MSFYCLPAGLERRRVEGVVGVVRDLLQGDVVARVEVRRADVVVNRRFREGLLAHASHRCAHDGEHIRLSRQSRLRVPHDVDQHGLAVHVL